LAGISGGAGWGGGGGGGVDLDLLAELRRAPLPLALRPRAPGM